MKKSFTFKKQKIAAMLCKSSNLDDDDDNDWRSGDISMLSARCKPEHELTSSSLKVASNAALPPAPFEAGNKRGAIQVVDKGRLLSKTSDKHQREEKAMEDHVDGWLMSQDFSNFSSDSLSPSLSV